MRPKYMIYCSPLIQSAGHWQFSMFTFLQVGHSIWQPAFVNNEFSKYSSTSYCCSLFFMVASERDTDHGATDPIAKPLISSRLAITWSYWIRTQNGHLRQLCIHKKGRHLLIAARFRSITWKSPQCSFSDTPLSHCIGRTCCVADWHCPLIQF